MAKKEISVLFFVVALLSIAACTITDSRVTKILQMVPKEVHLPDILAPENAATSCAGLWQKEGQACDLAKLRAYSKSEDDKIVTMLADLNKRIDNFHCWINQVNYKSVPGLTEDEKLFFSIWSDPVMVSEYQKDAATCWKQMKSKRSSSLCSVCSGQNYKYFLGNKAIIDENACDDMLNSCLSFFGDSLDIPLGARAIKKVFLHNMPHSLKRLAEKIATKIIRMTGKFMMDIETLNIIDLLHTRKNNDKTSREFKQASIKLCDYFVRIRKEPLLGPLIRIMKFMGPGVKFAVYKIKDIFKMREALQVILSEIKALEAEEAKVETKNRIAYIRRRFAFLRLSNRRLVLAFTASKDLEKDSDLIISTPNEPNSDLFSGDATFMIKSDNMFTSFDGVKGSTLSATYSNYQPMDLAITFP